MLMLLPLLQGGKAQILPLKRSTQCLPQAGTVQCENRPENGNNRRAVPAPAAELFAAMAKSRHRN
jgi:hypothetical protein